MQNNPKKLTLDDAKKEIAEAVAKIMAQYDLEKLDDQQTRSLLKEFIDVFNGVIANDEYVPEVSALLRPLLNGIRREVRNIDMLSKEESINKIKLIFVFLNDRLHLDENTIELVKNPFGPLRAPSTDLVTELNNIDFAVLIGGPMQAAIKAQADASMSSVDFIKSVGFNQDGSDLNYVTFNYIERGGTNEDGTPNDIERTVNVPLLSMLTVPSLRIDTLDIDFHVKLNSVEREDISSKLNIGAEAGANVYGVNFKVSAAYQRSTSSGVKVEKEYSMNVKVKTTQSDFPPGIDRILNLLAA